MSTMQESRQQAALRVQSEQLSKLIMPGLETKVKDMVDKLKLELMLEMEAEIQRKVKEQVEAYCKTVFDAGVGDDEHFHMIREQSDERPSTPDSDENRYIRRLSDPPVLSRQTTDYHTKIQEAGADNAWYWLGGKKVSERDFALPPESQNMS